MLYAHYYIIISTENIVLLFYNTSSPYEWRVSKPNLISVSRQGEGLSLGLRSQVP